MPFNFVVQLAIGIALMAVGFLLTPRPKVRSGATGPSDFKTPKANAGDPIPVIFGTVTIFEPNILWEGDSKTETYQT